MFFNERQHHPAYGRGHNNSYDSARQIFDEVGIACRVALTPNSRSGSKYDSHSEKDIPDFEDGREQAPHGRLYLTGREDRSRGSRKYCLAGS